MSTELSVRQAAERHDRSLSDLRKDAHAARLELATTLDAIEHKLDVKRQLRLLGLENPLALLGVAAAAGLGAGGVVWLGLRAILRR
ncbi:DUF3618 domain-containing protein [Cryobacterium tepidiphilum]|jgi:hypothetical protein|uniref:DUF3618 domain-containing protein n=1 Tax=Cryobacterium tepidiphilum TaxID=2486026 RepID=A0A3M8LNE3_9MICO|nr:DUF3618 domain-containing protein [Cryobacterium tepidiphilum]RNE67000.1 DUF3618 domain-containing protein [Cryobacterium tepidiphilum]